MNPLQRTLIEKTGHDNGFEYVLPFHQDDVALASALHPAQVKVMTAGLGFVVRTQSSLATLAQELARSFANQTGREGEFVLETEGELALLLRRAAALSKALPNQAVAAFDQQVEAELSAIVSSAEQSTEVLRLVRQRVGQQAYRQAMLDYWGGICAVTGLAVPQVLRASHAKPWAECSTDVERLDVYNGFLLSPNLDALFDSFLISFTDEGALLTSDKIGTTEREQLGFNDLMNLRWVAVQHLPYLRFHRDRFFTANAG